MHLALLAGSVLIGGALFSHAAAEGVPAYGSTSFAPGTTVALFTGVMVLNMLLAGFGIFADSGSYAPGGSLMPFVSLTVGGILVACASFFMVREHRPAEAVGLGSLQR